MFLIVLAFAVITFGGVAYSCCVVAGRADREIEEMQRDCGQEVEKDCPQNVRELPALDWMEKKGWE